MDEEFGAEAGIGREEYERLRERLETLESSNTKLEARNAALEAVEVRRAVEGALAGVRFCEGAYGLAPSTRSAIAGAVLGLPAEGREAVVAALKGAQVQPIGTVGFAEAEGEESHQGEEALTTADRVLIRAEAARRRLPEAEVEAQFLAARHARAARGNGGAMMGGER